MLHAVTWSLVQTDSPAVLGITDGSPAIPLLLIARLRNGCARSGVLYCASSPLFLPAVNDAVWDDAVEQALQHHRTPLLVEMKRILTAAALPDRDRKGALMLAGFLALPELGGDVARCWQRAGDREAVLFEALWAALRCAGPEQLESLRPHLGRLDENDLAFLAQACERIGAIEWSHEHLMEHLSAARRRQYYPSDNQLREDLSRFAEDEGFGPGHIWAWLEGFERRRDPENRALRVVDAWLANHRTLRGLAVAATCVSAVGRRPDLAILNRYPIDGPLPEIVNLKRDAAFAVRRRSLE